MALGKEDEMERFRVFCVLSAFLSLVTHRLNGSLLLSGVVKKRMVGFCLSSLEPAS